jgi:hypothetical protein
MMVVYCHPVAGPILTAHLYSQRSHVVDDIDAELGLLAADLLDCGGQPFGINLFVIGLTAKAG